MLKLRLARGEVWTGFGLLLLSAIAFRAAERWWMKSRARRCSLLDTTGRCRCGYPSIGLPSPRCPECGRLIISNVRTASLDEAPSLQWIVDDRIEQVQRKHLRDPKLRGPSADIIEGFVD